MKLAAGAKHSQPEQGDVVANVSFQWVLNVLH